MSESKDKPEIHSTFPLHYITVDEKLLVEVPLTKQEYAAIHLRTPIKDTLDEMIEASRRDEFVKAIISSNVQDSAQNYYEGADALLAASKVKKEGE